MNLEKGVLTLCYDRPRPVFRSVAKNHEGSVKLYEKCIQAGTWHSDFYKAMLAGKAREKSSLSEAEYLYQQSLVMNRRLLGEDADHEDIAENLACIARVLVEKGDLTGAGQVYKDSFRMRARMLGDDTNYSTSLLWLANEFLNAKALEEAELICRECIDHVRNLHGFADHDDLSTALFKFGAIMQESSVFDEAGRLYCEKLFMDRRIHGAEFDHDIVVQALSELAKVTLEQGNIIKAEGVFRESLVRPNSNNSAALLRFGYDLLEVDALSDAQRLFRESLNTAREYHNADHEYISYAMFGLGRVFEVKSALTLAEDHYRQNLEMNQRLHEEQDNEDIASSMESCARLLVKKGDLVEGERMYRNSFDMCKRIEGAGFDYCDALMRLGQELLHVSAYSDAERVTRESLHSAREFRGESADHEDIANALYLLGRIFESKNVFSEAEKFFQACLEMEKRLYGEGDDENVAVSMQSCAGMLVKKGDLVGAERMYGLSFEMRKRHDDKDFSYPMALANWGCELENVSALEDAERVYRECLDSALSLVGENVDSEDVARALCYLGSLTLELGLVDEAKGLIERSIEMHRRLRVDGQDSFDMSCVLYYCGYVALAEGQYREADLLFQESLDMDRRLHGENIDDDDICMSLCGKAQVALRTGHLDRARELLLESLAVSRRLYGEDADDCWIGRALRDLARVSQAEGALSEAEEYCRRSVEMFQRLKVDEMDVLKVARSCRLLADLQYQQGHVEIALVNANSCLEMYEVAYKRNLQHRDILQVKDNLERWNAEVTEMRKSSETIQDAGEWRLRVSVESE